MLLSLFIGQAIAASSSPRSISFTTDDGVLIYANEYGKGRKGLVLAHGGQYQKESWEKQASVFAKQGFHVIAFDFRGFGQSRTNPPAANANVGRHLDVLAAVKYLRGRGAKSVAVIGASMGGDAAAQAIATNPVAIDRIVLLASGAYTPLINMRGPKLFIMAADDVIGDNTPRINKIREQFEQASEPKHFVTLGGAAHAQALFTTDQGDRLMRELLRFISSRN